jgi:hypothetical protein
MPDPKLVALLDTVIPPGVDQAGAAGLAARVLDDAAGTPLEAGLDIVLAALPQDYAESGAPEREARLHAVAAAEPAAMDAVVNLVYTAYYTDPDVLAGIEALTGYHAGPPQPRGYDLAPFDPDAVSRVRLLDPIWRETS